MTMLIKQATLALAISATLLGCSQEETSAPAVNPEPAALQTSEASTSETLKAVDERYIWNLNDLFESDEAWEKERQNLLAEVEKLNALEGTLGDSPEALLSATDTISQTYKAVVRLYIYASLKADESLKNADNEEARQLARVLYSELVNAVSWYSPELLAMGEDKVRSYMDSSSEFDRHRHNIEDTLRQAPYTKSTEVEAVMAQTSKLTSGPSSIYSILANADMPWPDITLSDGETLRLSQAGYTKARAAENRDDRKEVFKTFWGVWKDYEATMGTVLNNHIQGLVFSTEVRGYNNSLERSLAGDNIPEAVYRTLVEEVNKALPTLHRYFKLRKRMLGIEDDLEYFDIYPPMVELDKTYDIEAAITKTREAIEPLGEEYLAAYDMGVEGRWMHVYPQEGKRSGGYMSGSAYDVHPYILLNYNDDYESVSTFAHEFGHAVHSVLTNADQAWENADYSIFVAETAAIMNEMLLQDLVIEQAKSPEEKLYYLGISLEALRGTYFRQTMFAEFELLINEEVEAGGVLTGAKLSEIYLELLKRYHGHDEGVLIVDEAYAVEWAYIPHFYYDFYVYQYSTSIAAAADLAEKINAGDTDARDKFLTMLKAGGSDYPYDLMKAAGLDMATPAPYRALETRMNAIMDEMEAILSAME